MLSIFDVVRKIKGAGLTQYEVDMINGVDDDCEPARPDKRTPHEFPISAIDLSLLQLVSSNASEAWVKPIQDVCKKHDINNIRRIAAFITTLAHEGGFRVGARENMNYSAKRLSQVWPGRFRGPNAKARRLHRNPEAIANEVYANRMGNGNAASGDGWRYRGNGPIQLTGKNNHAAFAKSVGMKTPDAAKWISTIEGGVASAAWFWSDNGVNRLADTPGIGDETKRINGGNIGIKDRKQKFDKLVKELLKRERKG